MSPPKFRVRTLMILIAAVAIAISAETTRRRHVAFQRKVESLTELQTFINGRLIELRFEIDRLREAIETNRRRAKASDSQSERDQWSDLAKNEEWMLAYHQQEHETAAEAADYFGQLATKYRYAASHPWLPVAPDPK